MNRNCLLIRSIYCFVLALLIQSSPISTAQAQAIESLKKVAVELNDDSAQFLVGYMYDQGQGVPGDKGEAAVWYRKAADQQHPQAQYHLALLLLHGDGVTQNIAEALTWLEKASQKNDQAAVTLGKMYLYGDHIKKDYKSAFSLLKKAAVNMDIEARLLLSHMYRDGRGVKADSKQWIYWLKKAAAAENTQAQHELAIAYANGHGVQRNINQAKRWFKLAADKSYAVSQYELGMLYATDDNNTDFDKAIYYLQQARKAGFAKAGSQIHRLEVMRANEQSASPRISSSFSSQDVE